MSTEICALDEKGRGLFWVGGEGSPRSCASVSASAWFSTGLADGRNQRGNFQKKWI